MIKRSDLLSIETLFPLLVLGFSLFNLYNEIWALNVASSLLSVAGITGVALYLAGNKLYKKFFYSWILLQLLIINHQVPDYITGSWSANNIWDLSQVFNVNMFINFGLHNGNKYGIGINFLTLMFFIIFKVPLIYRERKPG